MTEQESMASDDDLEAAKDPAVGAGTPQDAPQEKPPASLLERQPATVIGAVVAIADAAVAVAVSGADTSMIAAAAGIAVITMIGAVLIKSKVTPIADPKLDADTPLVPGA
jgi:hypothetical protein